MEECNGFGNTGYYQNCDSNFKVMRGLFIVPTFDADGVKNSVPAGTLIDSDFLSGKLNETDPLLRWYPLMPLESAVSERADPTLFTNPSGAIEFVKDGVKNLSFELRQRGSEFKGQIESCPCSELSFFAIDLTGRLRGLITGLDEISDFFPVPIQPGSFYSKLVDATEENPEHLTVNFQYELTVKDSLLRVYPENLTTASLLSAKGLYDVFMDISGVTTTAFTAGLRTIYTDGSLRRPTGLLVGDFDLYDVTTAADIVITSVTETSPGIYHFVIPTTTTSNVKRLTPTKIGFDFTNVIANTFTTSV